MRLASKIFLGFSLVIVVLAAVGVLGLRAVGRLVSVNREITSETLPALRLTTGVRDTLLAHGAPGGALDRPARPSLRRAAGGRAPRTPAPTWPGSRDGRPHRRRGGAPGGGAARPSSSYHAAVAAEHTRLLAERARPRTPSPVADRGRGVWASRSRRSSTALQQATHARVLRAQAEAARLEQRTWNGVVVALAAALGLALLATAVIALRITRSLRRLSAATAAVAAGSFREPIAVGGRDEVGVLARSFNAMAARLRQHDEMKEEFFATLSHELRSPITSVREAAHLLRRRRPRPAHAQADAAGRHHPALDRPAAAARQPDPRRVAAAGRGAAARARPARPRPAGRPRDGRAAPPGRRGAGRRSSASASGTRFTVLGDEDRLVQVVVNLLANAVRFTPVGGRVIVRLVDAGAECEIQVEDTGRRHSRRRAAAHLRVLPAGASRQGRHRARAGHRARPRAGARRPRHRRVAGGQGQPLHRAPAPGPGRVSALRRVLVASLLAVAVGGCALVHLAPPRQPLLDRADRLAREGALEDAATAYGEYPGAASRGRRGAAARRPAATTLRALLDGARRAGDAARRAGPRCARS